MIERSEVKCRKDSLWQRMLIGGKLEEKDNVSLWTKTKFFEWFFFLKILKYTFLLCDRFDQTCTTFFFLHLQLQKLEFEEFLELLGMSVQMSLDSIDAKLIPFLNMNFLWYSGLFKRLQAKYPDTHRCFTSSDGLVQYIVSCHAIKSNTVCTDVFRVRFWLN